MSVTDYIKNEFTNFKTTYGNRIKKIVLSAPFWIILVALFIGIFFGIRTYKALDARIEQNMARYWEAGGDTSYRQLTVFGRGVLSGELTSAPQYIDNNSSIALSDISLIREKLQAVVDSDANRKVVPGKTADTPDGWEDCYSTWFTGTVSYEQISSDTEIYAVGGNFRAFHPFECLSGGFLPTDAVDNYQIVLNDDLAWKMFSSYDVTGRMVQINDKNFTVIGVIKEHSSRLDELAGTENCRAYIYFSAAKDMASSDETGLTTLAVLAYEVMLPEAIRGVARTDIISALPSYSAENSSLIIVDNTSRFSIKNIWDSMVPFGVEEQKTVGFSFPYWETAARLTVNNVFFYAVFIAFAIFLLLIGIITAVLRNRKFAYKNIVIEGAIESGSEDDLELEAGEDKKFLGTSRKALLLESKSDKSESEG